MRNSLQSAPVVFYSPTPRAAIEEFRVYDNCYVIGAAKRIHSNGRTLIGSHGAGVLRGRFIDNVDVASDALANDGAHSLSELGQDLKGSLTLYVAEPASRKLTVLPDPLGGGLVFTWQENDDWAVSSDLAALTSFLEEIGRKPRKSLHYVAAYVATGSGGLIESSFENVLTLPQFAYVEMTPAGVRILEYPCKGEFFNSSMSYEESLQAAEDEILCNVAALAGAGHDRRVAHLTGGVDSRVVLAATLAAGISDKFSYYCSGGPTEPDKIVSNQLALEYGLTTTDHGGLDSRIGPANLEQELLWPFQHTTGIISGVAQPGNLRTSTSIASGGYGELFRSFYNRGSVHSGTTQEAGEQMFGRLAFGTDTNRRLFSDTFSGLAESKIESIKANGAENGVRKDAQLDYFYLNRRNRYYVGEITRSFSPFVSRFDPLYSLAGASLGLRVDGVSRQANVIGMDLMERMAPGLSALPFDSDRFAGAYNSLRGRPEAREYQHSGVPEQDGVTRIRMENAASIQQTRPTPADRERANKLRMTPRLIAQFPVIREGLRELIDGLPRGEFPSVFNPRAVSLLIDREPNHRVYYRTARDLYAALLWYAKG
ncbi:hypothetical protein [Pseudarthrobacter sp. J47]|uniref:hypothetical protein n=1 Tax=Pseudarthrobacter sp. J47 TaxID=3116482 RepID=UPI002E817BA0|nr:hypothetical protein [Pseudarthrobacter sp. J47]